jgi:hypothetical protein
LAGNLDFQGKLIEILTKRRKMLEHWTQHGIIKRSWTSINKWLQKHPHNGPQSKVRYIFEASKTTVDQSVGQARQGVQISSQGLSSGAHQVVGVFEES